MKTYDLTQPTLADIYAEICAMRDAVEEQLIMGCVR